MPSGPDLLLQHLRDRSHELASHTVDLEPPKPFRHADVYLLSSLVQKAIRRGDLMVARRAGHQLYVLDKQRLWRRLAVAALEDIGIGCIETAAELIGLAFLPGSRRLYGGDIHALDMALVHACQAIKDRTGDHFGSIIAREPASEGDRAILETASPTALLAVVASSGQPWQRRLRAAVKASGRTEGPPYLPDNTETVLAVFRGMGVPKLLMAACTVYAKRQRDALPVFVPLAWSLRARGQTSQITVHRLQRPDMIGDMPAYAFDPVNTRLGRHAVDLFLRSHVMRPPYPPRMVAAAIWNSESALCDQTLRWTPGEEIRQRAYCADLTYRGLPVEKHDELNAWVARERPALTAARRAVWNSAVRASGKPAEALSQANLPLPVPEGRSRRG